MLRRWNVSVEPDGGRRRGEVEMVADGDVAREGVDRVGADVAGCEGVGRGENVETSMMVLRNKFMVLVDDEDSAETDIVEAGTTTVLCFRRAERVQLCHVVLSRNRN